MIAQFRFEYLGEMLQAAGCAITPDPKSLAINFHTGENLIVAIIDRADPRRISLTMMLTHATGNIAKAKAACDCVNSSPCCTKACAKACGSGFELTLVLTVYAEELSAFTNSLKAYTDDIVAAYVSFVDEMVKG